MTDPAPVPGVTAHPIRLLLRAVTIVTQITPLDIMSDRRGPSGLTTARHMAMALARSEFQLLYFEIGRRMNRNHTTVIDGIRRHERRLPGSPALRAQVARVKAVLSELLDPKGTGTASVAATVPMGAPGRSEPVPECVPRGALAPFRADPGSPRWWAANDAIFRHGMRKAGYVEGAVTP